MKAKMFANVYKYHSPKQILRQLADEEFSMGMSNLQEAKNSNLEDSDN